MSLNWPLAWRVKLFILGAKSKQVVQTWPKNNLRKKNFLDKKRKLEIQRHFSGIWSEIFIKCCQKCNPNVQRSVFRYHFFRRNLLFSIVYVIEAENSPIPGGFFQPFSQISFNAVRKKFWVEPIFWKKFLYLFWKIWEKSTNYFFVFLSTIHCLWYKLQSSSLKDNSGKESLLKRKFKNVKKIKMLTNSFVGFVRTAFNTTRGTIWRKRLILRKLLCH